VIVRFGDELVEAEKAALEDFGPWHAEQLAHATYADRRIAFPDPRWRAELLGRGEEKAAFCVCDHAGRLFVLEVIDERSYLNGRFVTGTYFGTHRVPGLAGRPFDATGPFGLRFTGLVKVREYVYGYEWSRFQWRPDRRGWIDGALTGWLHLWLGGRYGRYRLRYTDVHERNVLFEVRPWRARGVIVVARDWDGRVRPVRVRLAPIDLR
jgi:hypothetical protein